MSVPSDSRGGMGLIVVLVLSTFVVALAGAVRTYWGVQEEALVAFSDQQRLTAELLAERTQVELALYTERLWALSLEDMPSAEQEATDWVRGELVRLGLDDVEFAIDPGGDPERQDHLHPPRLLHPCSKCASEGMLVFSSPAASDGRYVVAMLPASRLAPVLQTAFGWMTDRSGMVVAHHDVTQLGTRPFERPDLDAGLLHMLEGMKAGEAGSARYRWPDASGRDQHRLAGYAPVEGTDGFSVAVSDEANVAFAGVDRALTYLQRSTWVMMVGLVLGTATFVSLLRKGDALRAERSRERIAAANTAAHTERLAQLGALTAGVAHDLRGPIGAIRLGLEELDEDQVGDPQLRRDLRRAIDLMHDITSDLTRFSRDDDDDAPATELGSTLRSTLRMVGPVRAARCEVVLEDPKVWVSMAGPRVSQVLLNLISNAFAVAERVRLVVSVGSDTVEVVVEDDGPGVPRDLVDRVFEPFFTTKPPGEGTGLGLPLCRRFVEEAGGTLTLGVSSLGGAALVMRLPKTDCRDTPALRRRVA